MNKTLLILSSFVLIGTALPVLAQETIPTVEGETLTNMTTDASTASETEFVQDVDCAEAVIDGEVQENPDCVSKPEGDAVEVEGEVNAEESVDSEANTY